MRQTAHKKATIRALLLRTAKIVASHKGQIDFLLNLVIRKSSVLRPKDHALHRCALSWLTKGILNQVKIHEKDFQRLHLTGHGLCSFPEHKLLISSHHVPLYLVIPARHPLLCSHHLTTAVFTISQAALVTIIKNAGDIHLLPVRLVSQSYSPAYRMYYLSKPNNLCS